MAKMTGLIQPTHLVFGEKYLWMERRGNGKKQNTTSVQFTAYDPCPAFVIVATEVGTKWRCPREELFIEASQRQAL